ncbi:MAG: iron-siderophore ABC transporter substrate-binding protein [Nostoc sp. DedQUE12a]|nr:iron-siderophore ABC transporter substrate-binding protein [Nostoc sp. DedQUE12a]
MRKKATRSIALILFFLTAIIALTISACNNITQLEQPKANSTAIQTNKTATGTPVATKIVSHAFGEVEIPIHPQRVVLVDDYFLLDSLLALDIKPVGYATCLTCIGEDSLTRLAVDIPIVGSRENPSLEKILTLKPDLILGSEWQKQSYPLLSAIAPTVMLPNSSKADFKRDLQYIAKVVGKSDRVEAILANYEKRIQLFRQKVGTKLKAKTVSVVVVAGSAIGVYRPDSIYLSQILSDIGLQFVPPYKKLKNDWLSLSIESLSEYDADFLFVMIVLERGSENLKSLSFLKQPIWQTLKAVQNKQVYAGQWLSVAGPITTNRFIDDLYQSF